MMLRVAVVIVVVAAAPVAGQPKGKQQPAGKSGKGVQASKTPAGKDGKQDKGNKQKDVKTPQKEGFGARSPQAGKQPASGNSAQPQKRAAKEPKESGFNADAGRGQQKPSLQSKSGKSFEPAYDPRKAGQSRESPAGAIEQQQNLVRLKADLQTLYNQSNVTPAQRQAVANDLKRILSGATQPSQQSINALANDLVEAVADGTLTPNEAMKLANDVAAVLESANISQQDVQQLLRDVQALLRASNVSQADAQQIYNDVLAIVRTAQSNSQTRRNR